MGLRLQLRKAQAEAGDIILFYGDGAVVLTIVSLISCVPALAGSHALHSQLVAPAGIPSVKVKVHGPVPVLMANAAVPFERAADRPDARAACEGRRGCLGLPRMSIDTHRWMY